MPGSPEKKFEPRIGDEVKKEKLWEGKLKRVEEEFESVKQFKEKGKKGEIDVREYEEKILNLIDEIAIAGFHWEWKGTSWVPERIKTSVIKLMKKVEDNFGTFEELEEKSKAKRWGPKGNEGWHEWKWGLGLPYQQYSKEDYGKFKKWWQEVKEKEKKLAGGTKELKETPEEEK